jgi:hypothetical protein
MAVSPRPVVIPLPGHEDDPDRAIRVYAASSLEPYYATPDIAKRTFLQGWFARPEYFGRPAHIVRDENILIDGHSAILTHFNVTNGALKYRGVSVFVSLSSGTGGFACVFREQDAAEAVSICDAIVQSTTSQSLAVIKHREYFADSPEEEPQNEEPTEAPRDDREDDDPQ